MLSLNTNNNALIAQNAINSSSKDISTAMQRLSTGKKINSAADDSAGLAIYNAMNSQVMSYASALSNVHQVIAMNSQASSDLQNITTILSSMNALAISSASSSTNSATKSINQTLFSQYRSQIDSIANGSSYNNLNLLNGTLGATSFQINTNQGNQISEIFPVALSSNLGILSPVGVTSSSISTNALTYGDLSINGYTVPTSLASSDNLSFSNNSGSAIAKAAAINSISSSSGVAASVNPNTVSGSAVTTSATISGTLTLNGKAISISESSSNSIDLNRQAVVSSINAVSAQSGVIAIDSGDSTHGISLQAKDGRNITIAFDGVLTNLNTGLAAAGTYAGSITLTSTYGNSINLGSTPSGNIANAGFSIGNFSANSAQYSTSKRAGVTSAPLTLSANDLVINGISIGAPVSTSDTATVSNLSSTPTSSAISLAAAINAASSTTQVSAIANPNVLIGNAFTASTVTSIYLNGQAITASLSASSTLSDVVTLLNKNTGTTGVTASNNGSGLTLTAQDGRNISISLNSTSGDGGSPLGLAGLSIPSNSIGNPITFISSVTLSSASPFSVSSGSAGNTNFKALGFTAGTLGGSTNSKSLTNLDISTQLGAKIAMNVLKSAMSTVSNQQSILGGTVNSMGFQEDYLVGTQTNVSTAMNDLMSTDYGQETTQLAKSQIIQQAATAMLAQANLNSDLVLSLLKH
jgi:flagellin